MSHPNHRSIALWVAGGLALLVLLSAPSARAVPPFPAHVKETLGMPCAPPCIICHATAEGGIGTVNRPFGRELRFLGVTTNHATLLSVLHYLEAHPNVDANGDGIGDAEELRQGRNPNDGSELCALEYGCSVMTSRATVPGKLLALLGGLLLGVFRRRIRPRRVD